MDAEEGGSNCAVKDTEVDMDNNLDAVVGAIDGVVEEFQNIEIDLNAELEEMTVMWMRNTT